jgi:hypothetical protein
MVMLCLGKTYQKEAGILSDSLLYYEESTSLFLFLRGFGGWIRIHCFLMKCKVQSGSKIYVEKLFFPSA